MLAAQAAEEEGDRPLGLLAAAQLGDGGIAFGAAGFTGGVALLVGLVEVEAVRGDVRGLARTRAALTGLAGFTGLSRLAFGALAAVAAAFGGSGRGGRRRGATAAAAAATALGAVCVEEVGLGIVAGDDFWRISSLMSFWMSARRWRSSELTSDTALPFLPARPVRPMRWT